MVAATFDTLKFANTLKAAGVPDKQAEAQATAFAEIIQVTHHEFTTKEEFNTILRLLHDLGANRITANRDKSTLLPTKDSKPTAENGTLSFAWRTESGTSIADEEPFSELLRDFKHIRYMTTVVMVLVLMCLMRMCFISPQ